MIRGDRVLRLIISTTALLSDENYRILWGLFAASHLPNPILVFGSGLQTLIEQHADALRRGKNAFAGITRTRAGIAFVGIGLIRPTIGRLPIYDKTRRYLVITRHINPTMLETLGNTFQINRLHTTQFAGEYSVPLRTEGGETLAYLSWQPRLPGAEAARAASNSIRLIAILAASLILLFIMLSSRGFTSWRAANSRREKCAHRLAEPFAEPSGID